MHIKLITVGKLKERYLEEAVAKFSSQLTKKSKLDIVEIQDEKTPEGSNEIEERKIKEIEGERILKHIDNFAYVFALAIEGKQVTTEELGSKIRGLRESNQDFFVFIIGGSLGLSQKVLQRADFKLSFSNMTFPHQLMRVILFEQLCRVF